MIRVWVALALLFPAICGAATHLLVIGANRGEPDEGALSYAERDAEAVAAVLRRMGGAADVTELYGEDANRVRVALTEIRSRLAKSPGATLIVYYSGHADARGLHLGGTLLPYDELKEAVTRAPARVRLLILDACRSGTATRVKGSSEAAPFTVSSEVTGEAEGTAIISSSAAGEDSHESDRLRGSFFTHHLVNGLRGIADRNGDGRVTLGEAYDYAYSQTLRASGRTASLQHPTFALGLKGRSDVVLTHLAEDRSRSGQLVVGRSGLYLVVEQGEDGAIAAEVAVPTGGGVLLLPPGNYFVQRRDRNAYDEWTVRMEGGAAVKTDELPRRTVAYARLVRKGGGDRTAIHGVLALGGARGGILGGEGASGQGGIGYSADLPWLTFGVRLRMAGSHTIGEDIDSTHFEAGLGLTTERVIDLAWLSISIGVLLEGVLHVQTFDTGGDAPNRTTWAFGFGALLGLERDLTESLVLRIEGGPVAQLFEQATMSGGVASGSELATPVTWWLAGGLTWRF